MSAELTPWQRFRILALARGHTTTSVAAALGWQRSTIHSKFHNRGAYRWLPGQQEKLAALLGVTLTEIWPAEVAEEEEGTAS